MFLILQFVNIVLCVALLAFVLFRVLWKAMDCHTETGVVQEVMLIFNVCR